MPRIYLPALSVTDNRIVLDSEKAHYLSTVLRCKEGDELTIFDGKGNCFRTVIARADKREVIAEVLRHFPCDFESPVHIILVQGLLKGEKMDWVIQKTTELGVREIIPVITERSQVRETRKAARWRKIAEEASRQSGRSVVPEVHEPLELKEFLRRSEFGRHGDAETRRHGEIKGCIFWEDGGTSFNEAIKKISVSPGRAHRSSLHRSRRRIHERGNCPCRRKRFSGGISREKNPQGRNRRPVSRDISAVFIRRYGLISSIDEALYLFR